MKRLLIPLLALFGLAAAPVELPIDATMFAELGRGAPGPDAINNNCLACHSGEMILTQPRLTRDEWAAEVVKMRSVYKAPVDPADDAAIIAWLVAMQDRR
ncbi:MAG: cytochrome c [Polymorphobacter sp.]